MIAGFILNKYHKYLWMIRCSAWGSFLLVSAGLGTFQTQNVLIVWINMTLAAACLIPVIPVSIDFAGELTFPQEPTVVTGFMLMSA